MRYAFVVALAALLGLASANPVAAQDRGRSNDDDDARVIVRGDDGDDRESRRGRTSTERGRDDDDRARGRTGSERGRDVEDGSRRSGTIGDIFGTTRRGDDRRQPRRGDDDWDDDDWDDDDWDDDDWDDDDYRGNRRNSRKAGPPFCRNGQGHPVHGRDWCRDKGFGVGGGYDDIIWDRRDTRGIDFPSRRGDRYMSGSILQDILGNVVYNRLGAHARDLRMSGPIRGRFNGPTELRLYAGNSPIARLIDSNRDGRADVVYFRR